MNIDELNYLMEVDFKSLPKLKPNKPSGWENFDANPMAEKILEKFKTVFPEIEQLSEASKNRVLLAIRLSFLKANNTGTCNVPSFRDFITCYVMSTTQEDVSTGFHYTLMNMVVEERVSLAN